MTLMPASAACCSTADSVVPSIEAITSALTPLVTMFSICASWFGNIVFGVLQIDRVALGFERRLELVAVRDPAQRGLGRHGNADGALVLREHRSGSGQRQGTGGQTPLQAS